MVNTFLEKAPVSEFLIEKMLQGKYSLGTYQQSTYADTLKWICFDFDCKEDRSIEAIIALKDLYVQKFVDRLESLDIANFVKEKQEYIIRALNKYEGNRKYVSIAPRQYVSGEGFDILGKSLRLKVSQGKQELVTTDGVFIFLTVRNKDNQKRKESLMNNWLKEMQTGTFNKICREIYPIFKKYDVEYPIVKVDI